MPQGKSVHSWFSVLVLTLSLACSTKKDSTPAAQLQTGAPGIAAPSSITLTQPSLNFGNNPTPTLRVQGVSAGFLVSIYADAACSNLLASGTTSAESIEITLPVLADGVYVFYATATDANGQVSACSTASASYSLVTQPPSLIGLSNDSSPKKSKTWSWSCSTLCTYRLVVDQSPATSPSGAYADLSTISQTSGDGSYFLHIQAKDAFGNESSVAHVEALLDNTPPSAPNALTLKTPGSSPANLTTPVITVGGVTSDESVSLFTDAACTTLVGNALSASTTVDITSSALISGAYQFYASATDIAGNSSSCSTATASYLLDATAPSISTLLPPINGTYSMGSTLDFQLVLTEPVLVTGTPCFDLNLGLQTRSACLVGGSGNNVLHFRYTVQASDDDLDGIAFADFEVKLSGGTLQDSVGNFANLGFFSVAPSLSGITVNTAITAPSQVTAVQQTNLTTDRKTVSFSWNAPNGNGNAITKYIIRYKKTSASQFTFLSPDPTTPNATISNLDTESLYDIQVAAFNGVIGPYSNVLNVSTYFNPKSLGALVWYEAKDVNADGVSLNDGTAITVLKDKSGNNNHASKVSGPSATLQTVDGFKVIRLDSAGYRTAASLGETPNTNVEIYIVAKTRQVTASFAFVNENQMNGSRFGSHFPWSDNNAYVDLPMNNRVFGNWGGNTNQFFAWTFRSSTTAGIALERNGVPMLSAGNRANTPPLKRWTIGSNYLSTTEYWKADLQAFFVFDKVLDPTQRAEFFNFIEAQYGVVMP